MQKAYPYGEVSIASSNVRGEKMARAKRRNYGGRPCFLGEATSTIKDARQQQGRNDEASSVPQLSRNEEASSVPAVSRHESSTLV